MEYAKGPGDLSWPEKGRLLLIVYEKWPRTVDVVETLKAHRFATNMANTCDYNKDKVSKLRTEAKLLRNGTRIYHTSRSKLHNFWQIQEEWTAQECYGIELP